MPKQLEDLSVHKLPESMEYIWGWYDELFNGGKISYMELDSWSRLTRRRLEPWEVGAIRALDSIYLKVQHDGSGRSSNPGTK